MRAGTLHMHVYVRALEVSKQQSYTHLLPEALKFKLKSRCAHPVAKLRVSLCFTPFPLSCNVVQGLEELAARQKKTRNRLQACAVNIAEMGGQGEE